MANLKDFALMGAVGKAHGIKGELSLIWHGDFAPTAGTEIYLSGKDEELLPRKLVSARWHKDRLLAVIEGVPDRTAAEALSGSRVFMAKRDLPPLEEDEFYIDELLGSEVALEDGSVVGLLDHLEFPADQEIWVIKGVDGREVLFPAREEFISTIDPEKRRITILPPPGLLDIYLA